MAGANAENVAIIGSGPAGYTAALYAGRANLKPVMFEGYMLPGGQLMTTDEVENYPGFPQGTTGPELMENMRAQAARWGAEYYTEDVTYVDLSQRPFLVRSHEREFRAHSIIIATGATAKRLHLPSEEQFWSKSISACATCDGASPVFQNAEIAVVGGGDSAAEESVFLTKYAAHVHLLVRREAMRASKTLQDRVFNNPNITVHWSTQPVDVFGSGSQLEGVRIRSTVTGEERDMHVGGLFYAIGHRPNTALFEGQIELDETGHIVTKPDSVETSVEGVYAAGDVQDREFRQAVTAAGTGCQAAMLAERWLSANQLATEYHQGAAQSAQAPPESQPSEVGQEPANDTAETFDIAQTRHRGGYALRRLFHESDRVIMVKYVSPSCGLCRRLSPILDKVVDEFEGRIHFVEVDIAEDPDIAEAAQVAGTPTVQFFRDRELLEPVLRGVKQKSEYREVIERYLPAGVSS